MEKFIYVPCKRRYTGIRLIFYYNTGNMAFTLVELLMIVSIIIILMSMLMPALNRARDKSKEILCLGNQKQSGLAFSMYAQDSNGMPIMFITGGGAEWDRWSQPLYNYKYLSSRNVCVCPAYPPFNYSLQYKTYGVMYDIDYSQYNGKLIRLGTAAPSYWCLDLFKLPTPSKCMIFIDSMSIDWQAQMVLIIKSLATGNSYGNAHLRHSGGANVFFADGHASRCSKSQLAECGVTGGREKSGLYVTF